MTGSRFEAPIVIGPSADSLNGAHRTDQLVLRWTRSDVPGNLLHVAELSSPEPTTSAVPALAAALYGALGLLGVAATINEPYAGSIVLILLGLTLPVPLWRRSPWAIWVAVVLGPSLAAWFLVWVVAGAEDDPGDASAYAAMGGVMYIGLMFFLSGALIHGQYRKARPRSGWYVEPGDDGRWRYWDGGTWTDHTAPR